MGNITSSCTPPASLFQARLEGKGKARDCARAHPAVSRDVAGLHSRSRGRDQPANGCFFSSSSPPQSSLEFPIGTRGSGRWRSSAEDIKSLFPYTLFDQIICCALQAPTVRYHGLG